MVYKDHTINKPQSVDELLTIMTLPPEFKWKPLLRGTNKVQNIENKMERVRAEWAAGAQKQNTRMKPEEEQWFSSICVINHLLKLRSYHWDTNPPRFQSLPEGIVLYSKPLQWTFSVGFSEPGVSLQHAGMGRENLQFRPFWHFFNENIRYI